LSKRLHRERYLIERFFSKLKHLRRVATRNDKLAAMVQLASLRLRLRAYESMAQLAEILRREGEIEHFPFAVAVRGQHVVGLASR
jgi:hypothetical protein